MGQFNGVFKTIVRISIIVSIILFAIFVYIFVSQGQHLWWAKIQSIHHHILNYISIHPVYSVFIFFIAYTAYASLCLPGLVMLDVMAGFMFTQPLSTILVTIGATLGACAVFAFIRRVSKNMTKFKSGKLFIRIKDGFHQHKENYLLFMRVVPFFPFVVANIASALLNIRFRTFFWTTLVGLIPASFLFTQIGSSVGSILELDDPLKFTLIFTNKKLTFSLASISVMLILPTFFKKKTRSS